MKYATVAAFAAGAAASYSPGYAPESNGTTTYVTSVVASYTTYCSEATSFAHGGVTYTATASETVTVTNCPCTVSYPVTTAIYTSAAATTPASPVVYSSSTPESQVVSAVQTTTPVAPAVQSPSPNFPVPGNSTLAIAPSAPSVAPTVTSPVTSPIATFTGAANKAFAASGASLMAVFGLVAYAL